MIPANIFKPKSYCNKYFILFILLVILIVHTLYKNPGLRRELRSQAIKDPKNAIAYFDGGDHSKGITGIVNFREDLAEDVTIIQVELKGVPNGLHGLHIHEFGDISKGCDSAGAHYNPTKVQHGDVDYGHVGDLGNVKSVDGIVKTTIKSKLVKLRNDHSVIGRTLVLHENEDDLGHKGDEKSLTTGNSGKRIAGAIIGLTH